MTRAFFITGTDTGIGKTVASLALIRALRARGLAAVGMKPVAAGAERCALGWRNDDARALQQASAGHPDYALVNPVCLPDATTPQLAASLAAEPIRLETLLGAYEQLAARADVVVIEGAGGWLSPWAATLDQSALVRTLGIPVILVCGLRLGGISHARLSARAVIADGCTLAGWIGNHLAPEPLHPEGNLAVLAGHLPAPCLGVLPQLSTRSETADGCLRLDLLLGDLPPRRPVRT